MPTVFDVIYITMVAIVYWQTITELILFTNDSTEQCSQCISEHTQDHHIKHIQNFLHYSMKIYQENRIENRFQEITMLKKL